LNPFDLPGPEFLAFYVVLGAIVTLTAVYLRRMLDPAADSPVPPPEDPYLVAFLRGGAEEAARVAVMSLIDRGLLQVENDRVVATTEEAVHQVRRPIEKEVVAAFRKPTVTGIRVESALREVRAGSACREYEKSLTEMGLLPDERTKTARWMLFLVSTVTLLTVAFLKVMIALGRGRHNVGFLILLAAAFAVLQVAVVRSSRTRLGDRLLSDLKVLFARLKDRASWPTGGATSELAWLAAVFGAASVPYVVFPHVDLFRPRQRSGDGASHSGNGSSCGGSCGSSCGGGCGGGCGGCGS
jgi:uncharacterized protein (TIGR04222 family)